MLNKNPQFNLFSFIKRRFIFIILILLVVFFEITINNPQFFITVFQNLKEIQFEVDQGTIFGFKKENGQLIAEHDDPHITLRNIDNRVRYISVKCTNPNPQALSQVFFRRIDEDWDEDNSITFPLRGPETTVSLPATLNVTSLRLDLTNKAGDSLACQGFTLNPRVGYEFSAVRLSLLVLGIAGLLVPKKFIPEEFSDSAWQLLTADGIWIFILLIVLVNLAYPLTITYDAAHYLWLTNLIRTGDWVRWDPIRYLGFPLHIFLSLTIIGNHEHALLFPIILAHMLLFIFSCQIVFDVFPIKKGKARFLTALLIFFFIALDPTVVGYFHTMLTEYYAATIAVMACSIAIKLYQAPLFSKRFFIYFSIFFILVPLAWHIKQPYIGAAFFPLLIVSLLMLLRQYSRKTLLVVLGVNIGVVLLVIGSTVVWNNFLRAQGNPMRENRQINTHLRDQLAEQVDAADSGFFDYLSVKADEYLAIANLYRFNFRSRSIIRIPQIGRGNENTMIAHRMFIRIGESNLYFNSPRFRPYTTFLAASYNPPLWLNTLFQGRMKLSHTLFTISNLLLPAFLVFVVVLWVKEKSTLNASLVILSGSSLMNIIAHIFLVDPNDRYQFWGYVFNLIILTILLVSLVISIKHRLSNQERIIHSDIPEENQQVSEEI